MMRYVDKFLTKYRPKLTPWIFLAALLLYGATAAREPVIGPSASQLALHLGLQKFPPMSHFVWGWLVRGISRLAGSNTVLLLNFANAVLAAVILALLYTLVIRVPRNRTAEEVESRFPWEPIQCISGISAVLFLGLSAPFWYVATRAHPAGLHLFLLTFLTWLLVRFGETQRPLYLYGFAFLYGIGFTEFSTLILLAPIYGLVVLWMLWQSGRHRMAPTFAATLGLFVLGLFPYLIGALSYYRSPAYEWRQFASFFQVLWFIWRDQYREIRFGVPYVGSLLLFLTTILPWIAVASPKRAMTRRAVLGSNFFHLILFLIAVGILFNLRLSPWALFRTSPLLVTPYLLMATWAGYIVGYWYLFFFQQSRFESRSRALMRAIGRSLLVPVLTVLFALAGILNLPHIRARESRYLNQFVRQMLDQMGSERNWLATYGVLDDLIRVEAFLRGQSLNILCIPEMASKAYRSYIASLLPTSRLQSLALLGYAPLLAEWFRTDPEISAKFAVFENPDLWLAEGYKPLPRQGWFEGLRPSDAIDWSALLEENEKYWKEMGFALRDSAQSRNVCQPWLSWTARHISKLANNLGVLLEEEWEIEAAKRCYETALAIDTNNISALLNLWWLAERQQWPERHELQTQAEVFARRVGSRYRLWALAQQCGYVRSPEVFTRRGWAWVMSGKMGAGIRQIELATQVGAPPEYVNLLLASAYAALEKGEESEAQYDQILQQNPQNIPALFGKLRLSLRQRKLEAAAQLIKELRTLGAPESDLRVEEAMLELLDGNTDLAIEILTQLVKDSPKNLRAWSLLATLTNDTKLRDKAIEILKSEGKNSPPTLLTLAAIARKQGDVTAERNYLEQILKARPTHLPALERLLQLDTLLGMRDEAERRVEQILSIQPRHAMANYIYGSLLYSRGDIERAESAYRVAIEGGHVLAMNDLAWILAQRGQVKEAQRFIAEALRRDPNNPIFNDTAGVIFMKLGELQAAQQFLQAALARLPEHPEVVLHMALLYEKQGMREEAKRLAEQCSLYAGQLSKDAFDELQALLGRLRESS